MGRLAGFGGNDYRWGCGYGRGNVVEYWNTTYVSWQFSKIAKLLQLFL